MKNLITLCLFISILLIPGTGKAVIVHSLVSEPKPSSSHLSSSDPIKFDKIEIEQKLGRKLNPKEKIALKLIKAKAKKLLKNPNNQSNEQLKTVGFAITGLCSGLVGFLGFIIFSSPFSIILGLGFGILAIISSIIALKRIKKNPESKKGKFLALLGLFIGSTLLLAAGLVGIGYLM